MDTVDTYTFKNKLRHNFTVIGKPHRISYFNHSDNHNFARVIFVLTANKPGKQKIPRGIFKIRGKRYITTTKSVFVLKEKIPTSDSLRILMKIQKSMDVFSIEQESLAEFDSAKTEIKAERKNILVKEGEKFIIKYKTNNILDNWSTPDLKDFDSAVGPTTNTSTAIKSGKVTKYMAKEYTMVARKKGVYIIKPITAVFNGNTISSEEIKITVE